MSRSTPHVAILMATYNGARFLEAQLLSILSQTWENWSLWISDDGSSDETRAIIANVRARYPGQPINLSDGPRRGSTANFLRLIGNDAIAADAYALADQDDVWFTDKLARALHALGPAATTPMLYGARTVVTDAHLRPKGLSPLFRQHPGFGNALVQSIAGGNTMVMNRAARDLAWLACPAHDPVCHDWWLYQLVSGAGGQVIYDAEPVLHYRQHGRNLIGANTGTAARTRRVIGLLSGRFGTWNAQNVAALQSVRHLLTDTAQRELDAFAALRRLSGPHAVTALMRSNLFRQTAAGHLSLFAAAAIGRL